MSNQTGISDLQDNCCQWDNGTFFELQYVWIASTLKAILKAN